LSGDGLDLIVTAGADGTGSMSLVVDRPLRLVLAPTRMSADTEGVA
jgi:hypothetical protein